MTQKVSKTLVKASLLKLRSLVAAVVLFLIAQMGWAAEYYWVGGTEDHENEWGISTNWNPAVVPGSEDIVYIGKTATIDIGTSNVAVAGLSLANNGQSNTFTVTITGITGKLTVGNYDFGDGDVGIVTVRPSANGAATTEISNLIFDCSVDAQNLVMHSGGNVKVNSGKTVEIDEIANIGGNNPATTITVAGILNSTSISLSAETTRELITSEFW